MATGRSPGRTLLPIPDRERTNNYLVPCRPPVRLSDSPAGDGSLAPFDELLDGQRFVAGQATDEIGDSHRPAAEPPRPAGPSSGKVRPSD